MWKISFLFFSGILTCQFFPELPSYAVLIPALFFITSLVLRKQSRAVAWPIMVFLCGFIWSWGHALFILDHMLDESLEGKTLILKGVIIGLPEKNERRLRFDVRVKDMFSEGRVLEHKPRKIRLSWYNPKVKIISGETWRFQVRLKRPHGWRNPGGFDYEGWLFQHRINATGYVMKGASQRIKKSPLSSIDRQRQKIAERIFELLPDKPYAGVIQALLMGDRSHLSSRYWETLVNTGTIHLMAISGLHIGIIFAWFYFIGRWMWVIFGRLALIIPAQKIGVLCGVLGALLYAMLAGFSIPTQRALVMVLVGAAFYLLSRPVNRWAPLSTALFAVLIYDPLAVLSPGFWLSFWAVAIIFSCLHKDRNEVGLMSRKIKKWLNIQVALLIGLSPILFYFFHKVSLVAPLANLLAVPWVGLIIIPLIFIGTLLLLVSHSVGIWLLQAAEWQLGELSTYLRWLENSPIALWEISSPSLWSVIAAFFGAVMILFRFADVKPWRYRVLGGILFIPMLFISPTFQPNNNEFKVVILDIGQGLSIVIQTQQHALIYDTGPFFSDRFNAVDSALLPYLSASGINKIDRLIISHADKDHSGGVNHIDKNIPVDDVFGSSIKEFSGIFPNIQYCRAGRKWVWEGVVFEMISPMDDSLMNNNASCVLRVFTDHFSVLIPGDIEEDAELQLSAMYGSDMVKSNVIIAPHHGSLTSSTTSFLAAVNPQSVIFSTGYRNRFGFPKEKIVKRYNALGAKLYNTAYDGAIIIDSGSRNVPPSIQRYRFLKKHYWHR